MNEIICKKCGQKQWSLMDQKYAQLFPQCWSCDNAAFWAKELDLKVFEKRETEALELAIK